MTREDDKRHPAPHVEASGFFVMRTPLLPFEEIERWGAGLASLSALDDAERLERAIAADRVLLRERLREIALRPEVREAVFVGSPDLEARLDVWLRDPEGGDGPGLERAMVRYFVRMAARPTPFGLFAGCSLGVVGDGTRFVLAPRDAYRRHTRLDMDYLSAMTEALVRDPALRPKLRFRPNSSLYLAAGRIRLDVGRSDPGKGRSYRLVAIEPTGYLTVTLERARDGCRYALLVDGLTADDPEVSREEAQAYVDELIEEQLLVADLSLPVTGVEPVCDILDQLRDIPEAIAVVERLEGAYHGLEHLDAYPLGEEPARYLEMARSLEQLPAKVELSRLFQVDMIKPAVELSLGAEVLGELTRGVEMLRRMAPEGREESLQKFRDAFRERYEERWVPLNEVLDEEAGIGFERAGEIAAEVSPLLEGLAFVGPPPEEKVPWRRRESILLRKLLDAQKQNASEIALSPSDLEAMYVASPARLPEAFAVTARLAARSDEALREGSFQVLLEGISGPSGARLLGRFCHADDALCRQVEAHLRVEEACHPDAIFAEIVHLPQGRIGNIVCRPVLREYEIPFLGRSGAPPARQIPVSDLLVSVRNGRIVLRSARLEREVVPRLTTAHNFAFRSLGMYRFLCSLQSQGTVPGLGWDWGALAAVPFLPRVSAGRLVLSRARWRLAEEDLKSFRKKDGAELYRTVRAWVRQRSIPRFAAVADADNELLVDFDNPMSVETFAHLVKERGAASLVELFPPKDQLCVRGPEGQFVNELVIPFVTSVVGQPPSPPALRPEAPAVRRRFAPGSEWLFAKVYTGSATADHLLRETIGPLTTALTASGAVRRWFFIRYADPETHLRVRFHGDPPGPQERVLPALEAALQPLLGDGRAWRFQLDTYEREVERYGGRTGIELAERIFHADSEAVLEILKACPGDAGLDFRWRLALCGIDTLLDDLGLGLDTKRAVLAKLRESFGREFRVGAWQKARLADKLRGERRGLLRLLETREAEEEPLSAGLRILEVRSEPLRAIAAELASASELGLLTRDLPSLAESYIHMHVNRMLRSAHRAQELVLYDFLHSLYESQAARRVRR